MDKKGLAALRVTSCAASDCVNDPVAVVTCYRRRDGQHYQLAVCEAHILLRERGDYDLQVVDVQRAVVVTHG